MKLEWDFSKLFAGLDKYTAGLILASTDALKKIAMDGLGRMIEAAPIQTGLLRGSGTCHVAGELVQASSHPVAGDEIAHPVTGELGGADGKSKTRTVLVWGFNVFYAAKVHENPNAGVRGGGPKYVERILRENTERWMRFLADEIKKADKKGATP